VSKQAVKLALVTGGYRRLGAAIAARLAADGWSLALHCHSASEPDPALASALHTNGTAWHGFHADLADEREVVALIPKIVRHFGAVPTLLVNNASRFDFDDVETISGAAMALHHAVNVAAPVLLATQFSEHLSPGEVGTVVNILDQRIKHPGGDQISYTLSKQGLWAATETLARALAPHVRVNAVAPGLTLPTDEYRPAQMSKIAAAMPLKLLPDPEDVADAVAWLAEARATTGQTIFVDGGASLKSYDRDFLFMGD
jgi:pteridine reductase